VSVRPYNPVHSVSVLAVHLVFMFLRLTCVKINDDDDDDDESARVSSRT